MRFNLSRDERCAVCGAVAVQDTPTMMTAIVYCPNYLSHDGEAVQGVFIRSVVSEWNRLQRRNKAIDEPLPQP